MKNYKDMADAVFARRDEYVASVKKKKKIAFNAGLSLCTICLAVLGAFGIWKTGVLSPDPNVIGTKPQSYTEPTEVTLSGNATSQGDYSETTEHISGNSKPQSPTGSNTNPTEGTTPQPTDPVEKPTLPAIGPNLPPTPGIKPTLPALPTTPVIKPTIPNIPVNPRPTEPEVTFSPEGSTDAKPDLPITSPDLPQTGPGRPPVVIPDVTMPPPPVTDSTARPDEPEYNPPEWTAATEPCTEPNEPNDAPCTPETQAPMDPTEPTNPPVVEPTVPTEALENIVEGVVVDQYGNPVKGAVIMVYSGNTAGPYTTGSNGYFCISGYRSPSSNDFGAGQYVAVTSVPDGYSISDVRAEITNGYNYIVLVCNKK